MKQTRGEGRHALALVLLVAGCASESGGAVDAATDHLVPVEVGVDAAIDRWTPVDHTLDDLGSPVDAGPDVLAMDAPPTDALRMDSTAPRCDPWRTVICACPGGGAGLRVCSAEEVYGECVCPDAGSTTDAGADVRALDIPVRPLGPRLITPQSISRTTTQRPTFRWVSPEGVTRARVTVARDRALTMDVRTGMAAGTSWRPTEPLPFAVWFWRVEGLGDDGGVVWTSPTWEFRAPRRDTAVDSSWGTWRDFNGDGYDDLALVGDWPNVFWGGASGLGTTGLALDPIGAMPGDYLWGTGNGRVADINGDGLSDFVFLLSGVRYDYDDAGLPVLSSLSRLCVYLGSQRGVSSAPQVVISDFEGASDGLLEYRALDAGDFNGDGYGDVLVAVACVRECAPSESSRLVLYPGSAHGLLRPESIGVEITARGDELTLNSRAADLNQDGLPDFSAYLRSRDDWGRIVGESSFVSSLAGGSVSLPLEASRRYERFTIGGDIDGDGRLEWMLSVRDRVDFFRWMDSGPVPSTWSPVTAPDLPSSIGDNESFGSRVKQGDIDGDGYGDIVIGAPEAILPPGLGLRGDGRVYLYLGAPGGPSPLAARWDGRSNGLDADFGISIGARSDYDGDGYDDISAGTLSTFFVLYGAERAGIGHRVSRVVPEPRLGGRFTIVD